MNLKRLIKPLYKSGSKNDMLNFRPISILSQIYKYLEKIIKFRLVDFLNKYSIIDKHSIGSGQIFLLVISLQR